VRSQNPLAKKSTAQLNPRRSDGEILDWLLVASITLAKRCLIELREVERIAYRLAE